MQQDGDEKEIVADEKPNDQQAYIRAVTTRFFSRAT